MAQLIITTIQTHLYWQEIDKNLAHFDDKVNAIKEHTDILVLLEMLTIVY